MNLLHNSEQYSIAVIITMAYGGYVASDIVNDCHKKKLDTGFEEEEERCNLNK